MRRTLSLQLVKVSMRTHMNTRKTLMCKTAMSKEGRSMSTWGLLQCTENFRVQTIHRQWARDRGMLLFSFTFKARPADDTIHLPPRNSPSFPTSRCHEAPARLIYRIYAMTPPSTLTSFSFYIEAHHIHSPSPSAYC